MAKKKETQGVIELARLVDEVLAVPIIGLTPIIPHRWSEKAKQMMPGHPDKGSVKQTKTVRKPEEEARGCLYFIDEAKDRIGIPATAFKAALVDACRFFDKPSMVEAKQILSVEADGGELVEIFGKRNRREDTPRNANGGADLRYRYEIVDWQAIVRVRFVAQVISAQSVVALLDAAGRGGCGDWRPSAPKSKTGTFGTWRIDENAMSSLTK